MASAGSTFNPLMELSAGRRIYSPVRLALSLSRQWRLLKLALVASDTFSLASALLATYLLRFTLRLPFFYHDDPGASPYSYYAALMAIFIPVWLFIAAVVGLYARPNLLGGTLEYSLIFRSTTLAVLLFVMGEFLDPAFIIARGWLLAAWIAIFLFVAVGRFALRRLVYYGRHRGYFLSPTVIVGGNAEGCSLAEQLLSWKTSGLQLVGFVDTKMPLGTPIYRDLRVLGGVDELDEIIARYGVEEIILSSSAVSSRDNLVDIFKCYGVTDGINVRMSSGLYEILTTGLTVKEFAYVPLVGLNKVRLTGIDWALKWCLDVALGLAVLAVLWPVLLVIALVVKLDSPGPVLHRRRVMGVNGQQFDALKFRTMFVDGDEILEANPAAKAELVRTHKLKRDPRVTRVGRFLRKYSLDELPQVFNVLRRQMSLVGPRMIAPAEMAEYEKWGINLLTIPPGITGLWQVSGRSDVSYEERVRLDMYYIRNWTIWFDLQLILHTVPAVLHGRGAY